MRILILQNNVDDEAAYLSTFLVRNRVAFDVIAVTDGKTMPRSLEHYTGMAILGGPNSVNDANPALRSIEALVRDAQARNKPVLGHCLGGQLIAGALGARISTNPQPEIGWSRVDLADSFVARQWFGPFAGTARSVFQWHYETFELPACVERVATNNICANQAFVSETLLAMQFHIEVDAAKLARWATNSSDELGELANIATVQQGDQFAAAIPHALPESLALADQIFSRFLFLAGRVSTA